MRSRWITLRAGLVRSIEGSEATRDFEVLKSRSQAVRRYPTPAELVAAIANSTDLPAKDPVLRALVLATHERDTRRLAQSLLLLCFWPALDAIFRRRWDLFRDQLQDLPSEIVAGFTIEVNRIDLRRVACLTATLLRNTDRNLVASRVRERAIAANTIAATPDAVAVQPAERAFSQFGVPANQEDADAVATLRDWLQRAIGREADLVVDAVINGRNRRELADDLGISHAAARKRLARALGRAREVILTETGSQPGDFAAFAN